MDPVQALHTAARRYCMDRGSHWQAQYAQLCRDRRDRLTLRAGSWDYTPEARDMFPRYNVLATIQEEIESFTPADFASLADAREFLAAVGETAESDRTRTTDPIERSAIAAERREFVRYVRELPKATLAAVPPLPYRRILTAAESRRLYPEFVGLWGKWYGGSADRSDLPPHLTLHTAFAPDEEVASTLHGILRARGLTRLLEFREYDTDYELDLELATFTYTGPEGWWTSPDDFSWTIYASHESSLTFGGQWLIDAVRHAWPHYAPYVYKGWDLSTYDLP